MAKRVACAANRLKCGPCRCIRQTQLPVRDTLIHSVDICAEPDVVDQVPSHMIWIFVDGHLIGVPEPVVSVAFVVCSNGEVKAVEPKTILRNSIQREQMPFPETAREAAIPPSLVEMIFRIIRSGVVAGPNVVGMDVRRIRMTGAIR